MREKKPNYISFDDDQRWLEIFFLLCLCRMHQWSSHHIINKIVWDHPRSLSSISSTFIDNTRFSLITKDEKQIFTIRTNIWWWWWWYWWKQNKNRIWSIQFEPHTKQQQNFCWLTTVWKQNKTKQKINQSIRKIWMWIHLIQRRNQRKKNKQNQRKRKKTSSSSSSMDLKWICHHHFDVQKREKKWLSSLNQKQQQQTQLSTNEKMMWISPFSGSSS